ncbi:MAG: hypothetical protein Q8O71_03885 [bacterium]|nr:hypothetical protein [bacterium]
MTRVKREKTSKDEKEEMEFLDSLSQSFHDAYADEKWVIKQGEKYLRDAEKIKKKRFESFKLTFTTFVR